MNKLYNVILIILLGTAGLMMSSCSEQENKTDKIEEIKTNSTNPSQLSIQTKDAISGKPISWNIYTDYEGKRIFFCCNGSKKDFKDNPQRYLTEFQKQGVSLTDTP